MKKHFTNKSQMNMKFTAAIVATALQLVVALLQLHHTHGYDSAAYKDPHYVGRRTTMVHLFEWKFKDIAVECERFLGPTGYAAVQVSPVSECLILENRPWFERYQPISYKLISRSGNEAEFKDMVARCNRVGVRIYVDAVINHMTSNVSPARGTGDSTADPWQKKYPAVPYGPNDFHRTCAINNYQNASEVRNCELSGLHDLDQSSSYVRGKIVEFLNRVIDLGVAGLRIDGAKHMWPKDLEHIYANLHNLSTEFFPPNKRPFIYQEVIDVGLGEAVSKYEYNYLGTVIEFVFGIVLGRSFNGVDPLKEFEHWGPDRGLLPSGDAVVMVDNHDNQRGHGAGGEYILTYKKQRLYLMAVAFMLAHPYGHPRVMSSFNFSDPSQGPPATKNGNIISPDPVTVNVAAGNVVNSCNHGWVCEHRWAPISNMVQFRNLVQDAPLANWWSNGHNQIAFSRRNLGFVAFNGEYGKDLRQKLMIGLPAGKYCDVISGRKEGKECTGKSVTVNADGTANVELLKDEPHGVLAIHVESKLQ